jgi:hypothetical protein
LAVSGRRGWSDFLKARVEAFHVGKIPVTDRALAPLFVLQIKLFYIK